MNFESVFANPTGRTGRGAFTGALVVLVLAIAFYIFVARAGRNGQWVVVTLLYPTFVLLARRLHDMGKTAWLLVVPGAPCLAAAWFTLFSADAQLATETTWAALALLAVFAAWGLVAKSQDGANKYGEAAA